jgi:RNA polymerase sigma-70 factor (ECF subfamily)
MEQPETLTLGRPTRTAPSRDVLREVFDASYRRLVVQLYGVVGDAVEAEDLVQEAFVRASAAGQRFLRTDNPEAWLRTTAINLHRNRWRKLRSFAAVRSQLATVTDLPGLEEHLAVMEALRKLPAIHREVIALHYLADLDVTAIATTLGVAEGTVKSRLARGRDALATLLTEEDGDD